MGELLIRLLMTAAFTLLIKGVVALFHYSIAWWLALVIAAVFVFGGWLILVDTDGSWD